MKSDHVGVGSNLFVEALSMFDAALRTGRNIMHDNKNEQTITTTYT